MLIIMSEPIKPNSSVITEKIKSHWGSGRYPYFCTESPNPRPKTPQLPIAMRACLF
jgi:hypothetical protein